jgi:hypothetical protein
MKRSAMETPIRRLNPSENEISPLPENPAELHRVATALKKRLVKSEAEKEDLMQLNLHQGAVNLNQSESLVNQSESLVNQSESLVQTAKAAEKTADAMHEFARSNEKTADALHILSTTAKGLVDDLKQRNVQNSDLKETLLTVRSDLFERTKELHILMQTMQAHKDESLVEDNRFVQSMRAINAQSLFYCIANDKAGMAKVEKDLLDGDGNYVHPKVLICNLFLLNQRNLVKMLAILSQAVCLYDDHLGILLLLTASDDRKGVTDDHVDDCFSTLLPQIGYAKEHNLHFKVDGKDYTLVIASKSDEAVAGAVGHLSKVIAFAEGASRLCVEGSVSEGTPTIPFTPLDLASIFKEGRATTVNESGSHIEAFELSKTCMTTVQQQAVKTDRGKTPIQLVLHCSVLESSEAGTFPLLAPVLENGEPLDLVFKCRVGAPYTALSKAISDGRVGKIAIESVQLKDGEEKDLAGLLATAQVNNCTVSLSRMSHDVLKEVDLQQLFMEFAVSSDAFSEAAPTLGEDDYDSDYEPDDSKIKKPNYDIFGKLPDDLVQCNECLSLVSVGTSCGTCSGAVLTRDGDAPPVKKDPNLLTVKGQIGPSGFTFSGASSATGRSVFTFPSTNTSGPTQASSTGGFSFAAPQTDASAAKTGGFPFAAPQTGASAAETFSTTESMKESGTVTASDVKGEKEAATSTAGIVLDTLAAKAASSKAAKIPKGRDPNASLQVDRSQVILTRRLTRSQSERQVFGADQETTYPPRRVTRSQSERQVSDAN